VKSVSANKRAESECGRERLVVENERMKSVLCVLRRKLAVNLALVKDFMNSDPSGSTQSSEDFQGMDKSGILIYTTDFANAPIFTSILQWLETSNQEGGA